MTAPFLTIVTGLLMIVGLLGIFLPVLPGTTLIWLAALGYGLLVGWGELGPWLFALITVLAIIAAVVEYVGTGIGGRIGGASYWSIVAGIVLGFVGLVFFSPLGALAGLLLGAFLVEFYRVRDVRLALRGMVGMGLGYGGALLAKFVFGVLMVVIWVYWAYTG